MSELLLIDTSAYARGAAEANLDGEFCLCAISRREMLFSAKSPADYLASVLHVRAIRL